MTSCPCIRQTCTSTKKSKTTLENSLSSLQAALPVLEGLETWTNEALYDALVALAAKLEVKNSIILWPLRVAVSGKASTPGGATELCALLGKEESIARVKKPASNCFKNEENSAPASHLQEAGACFTMRNKTVLWK